MSNFHFYKVNEEIKMIEEEQADAAIHLYQDEAKEDYWLDDQCEDFSNLEEENEMVRQITEAEEILMKKYERDQGVGRPTRGEPVTPTKTPAIRKTPTKTPATRKTPAGRKSKEEKASPSSSPPPSKKKKKSTIQQDPSQDTSHQEDTKQVPSQVPSHQEDSSRQEDQR